MWMGRILGKYLFVGEAAFLLDKCYCSFLFVHIIYKLIHTSCIALSLSLVVITCQTDRGIGIALI